jgi:hypothetical protein
VSSPSSVSPDVAIGFQRCGLAALGVLLLAARTLHAEGPSDPAPRGPSEIRDEHVLAQPRLTLPATSPWTTRAGGWSFEVAALWSNSFSWDQDVPGVTPGYRAYLLDGETLTLDTTVRRGLRPDLDVSLRVPIRWRGGGIMDGLIDTWHRTLGLPDGGRPYFPRNAFEVEGATIGGGHFDWDEQTGTGLGDVELSGRWRFYDGGESATSLAAVGRVSLPTGSGPFAGNGFGGAGQLVLAAPVVRRLELYAALGATAQEPGPVRGVEYRPLRVHGSLAFEWRPWRRLSLLAETNAASRLVANIARYPGTHWLLNVTGRIDVGRRTRLDLGFTENIKNQLSTTDFALYSALSLRR